ncbi:hypothetical protein HRbin08_01955 [bacterium HR08]|nr:hypothetical protein HRbin08_01955 [bacterium HR08]
MRPISPVNEPRGVSLRDAVLIAYGVLFVLLGLIILYRVIRLGGNPVGLGVGGGFVLLGAYRLRFVLGYSFARKREGHSDVGR